MEGLQYLLLWVSIIGIYSSITMWVRESAGDAALTPHLLNADLYRKKTTISLPLCWLQTD